MSLLQEKIVVLPLEEYIILENFNLYHLVWGRIEIRSKNNSKTLLALVEQHGFYLLLKTGIITFNKNGHQSIIDLIFACIAILERLIICKILNNKKYGSNHHLILSVLNLETNNQTIKPKQQFKEINIKVLWEIIMNNSAQISDFLLQISNHIDTYLGLLVDAINKSIIALTLLRKITTRSKPVYNLECKMA